MGKMRPPRGVAWLAGLVVLALGCNSQDTERLGRVGQRLAARIEALTGVASGPLTSGWPGGPTEPDDMGLDSRVSARVQWDKALQGCKVQIRAQDGTVELTGTVLTVAQRRRAVELAESTVGADKVVDSLELAPVQP